jgi:hypothetical protein
LLIAFYSTLLAAASAQSPAFTLNWPDRRPIGASFLGSGSAVSSNNPRGWNFSSLAASNYLSTNGWPTFRNELIIRASNEVQILKGMNAQGVIFWDIAGYEISDLVYYGDPINLNLLAPEMDAFADQMFSIYTSAGLRVGICVRAQQFYVGTKLPASPTNGQAFVLANAPYGQKEYHCFTNGVWTQTTGTPWVGPQQLTNCFYTNFLAKIQYANSRWGATLFYVDSYQFDKPGTAPYNTISLQNAMAAYPNILLAPEEASEATTNTSIGSNYWAMTAPYLMTSYSGYFTPVVATRLYPKAFSIIDVTAGYTNLNLLIASMQAGNILLANSWYSNPCTVLFGQAYRAFQQKPPEPASSLHFEIGAP